MSFTSDELRAYSVGAVVGVLMAVTDAVNRRISLSRTVARNEPSVAIVDYHLGCMGALECLLEDIDKIRSRFA